MGYWWLVGNFQTDQMADKMTRSVIGYVSKSMLAHYRLILLSVITLTVSLSLAQVGNWTVGYKYLKYDRVMRLGVEFESVQDHTASNTNAPSGAGGTFWRVYDPSISGSPIGGLAGMPDFSGVPVFGHIAAGIELLIPLAGAAAFASLSLLALVFLKR